MKIPFSPPYIWEEEIKAVTEVLKSGWITTWPKNKEFEEKICNFIWCEKVNLVSSATAWLETVLRILWIWTWDEVIIPAYTYTATASSILHVWAKLVIVDINKQDFNISLKEIEKNITKNTKAIIPVDFWGYPVDYNWINKIIESKKSLFNSENKLAKKIWKIALISDSAHSFWWIYDWIKIWAKWLNDFTVYSFHAVKNLTTAEWWAITYNFWEDFNEEIYKNIKLWTLHWQTKDAFTKTNWNWEYDVIFPWYKANMTDIQAAIWIEQLKKYPNILEQREEIYDLYNEWLKKLEEKWILELPKWIVWKNKWSFHLYPILLNEKLKDKRNKIIEKLEEKWISANVHFKPLPLLTAYKELWYKTENIINAINKFEREISLPIWPGMKKEDIQYVINNLITILENV